MAVVKETLAIDDRVSPVLKTIIKGLDQTLVAMQQLDRQSRKDLGMSDAVKEATSGINAAKQAITDLTGDIGQVGSTAKQSVGGLTTEVNKVGPAAEKQVKGFESWQGAVTTATNMIQGIQTVTGIVGRVLGTFGLNLNQMDRAFARMDAADRYTKTITRMTGDTQIAATATSALKDVVTGTAYGLDSASRAATTFVNAGLTVGKSTQMISTLADAISAYGDGSNQALESVADNFQTMLLTGQVDMVRLKSIMNEGIPVWQIYAEATGQSVADVKDSLSSGAVGAAEFVDTLMNAMNQGTATFASITGSAKDAGASWQATFDNASAAIARGNEVIIKSLDSVIASFGLVNASGAQITSLKDLIMAAGKGIESTMNSAAATIQKVGQVVGPVSNNVMKAFSWIEKNTGIAKQIGLIGVALLAVVVAQKAFTAANKLIIGPMGTVVASVKKGTLAFKEYGASIITATTQSGAAGAKELGKFGGAVTGIKAGASAAVAPIKAMGTALAGIGKSVLWIAAIEAAVWAIGKLKDAMKSMDDVQIKNDFKAQFTGVSDAAKQALSEAKLSMDKIATISDNAKAALGTNTDAQGKTMNSTLALSGSQSALAKSYADANTVIEAQNALLNDDNFMQTMMEPFMADDMKIPNHLFASAGINMRSQLEQMVTDATNHVTYDSKPMMDKVQQNILKNYDELGPQIDKLLKDNNLVHNLGKDFGDVLGFGSSEESMLSAASASEKTAVAMQFLQDKFNGVWEAAAEGIASGGDVATIFADIGNAADDAEDKIYSVDDALDDLANNGIFNTSLDRRILDLGEEIKDALSPKKNEKGDAIEGTLEAFKQLDNGTWVIDRASKAGLDLIDSISSAGQAAIDAAQGNTDTAIANIDRVMETVRTGLLAEHPEINVDDYLAPLQQLRDKLGQPIITPVTPEVNPSDMDTALKALQGIGALDPVTVDTIFADPDPQKVAAQLESAISAAQAKIGSGSIQMEFDTTAAQADIDTLKASVESITSGKWTTSVGSDVTNPQITPTVDTTGVDSLNNGLNTVTEAASKINSTMIQPGVDTTAMTTLQTTYDQTVSQLKSQIPDQPITLNISPDCTQSLTTIKTNLDTLGSTTVNPMIDTTASVTAAQTLSSQVGITTTDLTTLNDVVSMPTINSTSAVTAAQTLSSQAGTTVSDLTTLGTTTAIPTVSSGGAVSACQSIANNAWAARDALLALSNTSVSASSPSVSMPSMPVTPHAAGGILTGATALGIAGGSLHIAGEAGPEAILPISLMRTYVHDEMVRALGSRDESIEITGGKLDNDDEELSLLRDIARTQYVTSYTNNNPTIQVRIDSVHNGEATDVESLVAMITTGVKGALDSSLR